MILKYYSWNKFSGIWNDMKIYCSLCNVDYRNPPKLISKVHQILTARKVVSFPLEELSFTNHSSVYTACYHLFTRVNGKNANFGKLEEIPNKNTDFKSSHTPWGAVKVAAEPVRRAIRGIRPQPAQFFLDEMPFMEPVPAAPAPVNRERLQARVNANHDAYPNIFADVDRVEPVRNVVEHIAADVANFEELWDDDPF